MLGNHNIKIAMKQSEDFQEWIDEEEMSEADVKSIGITFVTLTSMVVLVTIVLIIV